MGLRHQRVKAIAESAVDKIALRSRLNPSSLFVRENTRRVPRAIRAKMYNPEFL
jgi:hypothetical protein